MEVLKTQEDEKSEGFDLETYESTIDDILDQMGNEKKKEMGVVDMEESKEELRAEKLKRLDGNLASLFNYFDNKEVNKDRNIFLKRLLTNRIKEETNVRLDWEGKIFKNVNFSGLRFNRANLEKISVLGQHSDLRSVVFNDCNLSSAKFENTNMMGVEFKGVKEKKSFENVHMSGVNLSRGSFKDITLEKAKFSKDGNMNNLSGILFSNCDLNNSEFCFSDLNFSVWENTKMRNTVLDNVTLHKSKFDKHSYEEMSKNTTLIGGRKFEILVA